MAQDAHETEYPATVDDQGLLDMTTEYNVLLRQALNICSGMNTGVAIAALMSAAGCIGVQSIHDEAECRAYINRCTQDILKNIKPAYAAKAQQEIERGTDARGEGKDVDQIVAPV